MNANDALHRRGYPGLLRWALGLVMPDFFSEMIEKAGVSYTIITALTGRLRG